MKSILAIFILSLAASSLSSSLSSDSTLTLKDPTNGDEIFQVGQYSVQHKLYLSLFTWGLDHSVDVWAPQGEGTFPVIYFVPGIAGFLN